MYRIIMGKRCLEDKVETGRHGSESGMNWYEFNVNI